MHDGDDNVDDDYDNMKEKHDKMPNDYVYRGNKDPSISRVACLGVFSLLSHLRVIITKSQSFLLINCFPEPSYN